MEDMLEQLEATVEIPKYKEPWVVGSTPAFIDDVTALLSNIYEQCGEVSISHILMKKCYTLLSPDANEWVLLNKENAFSSKDAWDGLMDPLFRNGLMLKDGGDHRYHRRIMNAAFSREALQSYMEVTNQQASLSIQEWPKEKPFQFYPTLKQLTLDLATRIFMGIPVGDGAEKVNKWFVNLVEASCSVVKLPLPGTTFGKGLRARKQLLNYFAALVPEKREVKGADMLSRLTKATDAEGNVFSDEEIAEHMVFLMMAAHDTTTSALTSLIYFLVKEPHWQERLRAELSAVGSDNLNYGDLDALPLTGAAFKEALRMMPPLAIIPRVPTRDVRFGNYVIPKGEVVQICPAFTHFMPEIWQEPENFDPERFLPPRQEDLKHRFAYIPFGGGVHKCLGMHFAENQVKIILFHLLKNYEVQMDGAQSVIWQKVPIVSPTNGLPVKLRPI